MRLWHGSRQRGRAACIALAGLIAGCEVYTNLGYYPDAGLDATTCGALVAPTISANCTECSYQCQANGCYGGWWCNTASKWCEPPPTSCSEGDGGVRD